jgi:hypothetical protein
VEQRTSDLEHLHTPLRSGRSCCLDGALDP